MDGRETGILYNTLSRASAEIGVCLTPGQVQMCVDYASLMLDFNSHTNLTRITDPEQIAIKHFADSLSVLRACPDLPENSEIADVGTGAGFPGLVLKIARPDLRITLIDSLAKRLTFLGAVIESLRLRDVRLAHLRAEDAGRDRVHRDKYDAVTARAVASLPILLEWCCPLVHVGGRFIAMKSASVDSELSSTAGAARSLSCTLEADIAVALPKPARDSEPPSGRRLLVYRKQSPTAAMYPRGPAAIKANPLGRAPTIADGISSLRNK